MATRSKENGQTDQQGKADSSGRINISPARLFRLILSRWHWLAISVLVFFCIALIYAKSVPDVYMSEAILQYDKKSKEAKFSTTALINGGDGMSNDYAAEVYRVKSSHVVGLALDSLKTKFFFYRRQGLRNVNIYPLRPFDTYVLDYDIDNYLGGDLMLKKTGTGYDLRYTNDDANIDTTFKNVKAGTLVKIPGLNFSITSDIVGDFDKVHFKYIDYWTTGELISKIKISEAERNVPVMRATFNSDNAAFSKDFLNTIIITYSAYDLQTKRKSSENTLAFIQQQLDAFDGLMRESSSNLANIKRSYDLVDVGATSSQYMSSVSSLREKKLQLEIQGRNFDLVTDNIKNNKEVVASVIGWDGAPDPFLNNMLEDLNEKNAQRKQSLINFSEQSVVIRNLNEDIAALKHKIIENINLQKKKAEQAYKAYDQQLAGLTRDLSKMPTAERDLLYTTSDVDVNKNIYTLLLNKKLETSIDMAGQTASFSPIEEAKVARHTSPFELLIELVGCIVGLVIGILLIFLVRAFNSKFVDVGSFVKTSNVFLIGVIKHVRKLTDSRFLEAQEMDGALSESLNSIRTNILYQLGNETGKMIAVTSASAGEGKSFISINLAISLAKLNKSVILLTTDLRRSRSHVYFNDENASGLSDLLENGQVQLQSVIRSSSVPGVDHITSGKAVSNPSELLHKDRFSELLQQLKQRYDYVILDTAPVGLVSDSIKTLMVSDINIFVARWRYSSKDVVQLPYALVRDYEISRMCVIVNDYKDDVLYASMDDSEGGYGQYYPGYGNYYEDGGRGKRSLWKRRANK